MIIGWALVAATCFGTDTNCDVKQVTPVIYPTEQQCEWERDNYKGYYSGELTCAKVERNQ